MQKQTGGLSGAAGLVLLPKRNRRLLPERALLSQQIKILYHEGLSHASLCVCRQTHFKLPLIPVQETSCKCAIPEQNGIRKRQRP